MTSKNLTSAYDMPGYKASRYVDEYQEKNEARIVNLQRIKKKLNALNVKKVITLFMTEKHD